MERRRWRVTVNGFGQVGRLIPSADDHCEFINKSSLINFMLGFIRRPEQKAEAST
jgi:hypothetical protein